MENNISQKNHLLVSAGIALAVGFAVYLLVRFTAEKPATPIPPVFGGSANSITPEATHYNNPTVTISPNPSTRPNTTPLPTPSLFPTPFKGTLGPPGFNVGPWHDNYIPCDSTSPWVYVYGVEIYGGIPPYEFTFWQINEVRTVYSNSQDVEFDEPVRINKGEYVHVTITFPSANETLTWIDDLYYKLKDAECPAFHP